MHRGQIWLAAQAAELYAGEEQSSEANKCRLKVPGTPAISWRLYISPATSACHAHAGITAYGLCRALPVTGVYACLHVLVERRCAGVSAGSAACNKAGVYLQCGSDSHALCAREREHPNPDLTIDQSMPAQRLVLAAQVAQFAAELERYSEAIEIYEGVARASVDNNLLKYSAKGYLLNAGICQLCSARPGAHIDKLVASSL